jgi:hypothetical protein
MAILIHIGLFIALVLFDAICVLFVAKLVMLKGKFTDFLIVSTVSGLITYIPLIGWILSIVAMFIMLRNITDGRILPEVLFLVVVSFLVKLFVLVFAFSMFAHHMA